MVIGINSEWNLHNLKSFPKIMTKSYNKYPKYISEKCPKNKGWNKLEVQVFKLVLKFPAK